MPIFTYFAVAGSLLIALLLFSTGAPPEQGTRRAVAISDDYGLPKPWRPDRRQRQIDAAPAPAPDMTSPLVLAAQPKDLPAPEVLAKVEPAARAARAEALIKERVSRTQPPVEYRQNDVSVAISRPPAGREFGLSGSY
jgi:hypothetical protein